MSNELISNGPKRPKRGKSAEKIAKRRATEARQAEYAKLTIEQKLSRPTLGAKERAKLLSKQQNQKGASNGT